MMKEQIKQSHKTVHSHTKQKSPRPCANPQHAAKMLADKDILNIIPLGNTKRTCCPKPPPCYNGQEMARTAGMLGRARCNAASCQGYSICRKGFSRTFKKTLAKQSAGGVQTDYQPYKHQTTNRFT